MAFQTIWDERFTGEHYVFGEKPNAFLVRHTPLLASGSRILVPGDGEGRNGVWLARMGMDVLSVDSSAVGLGKAKQLAGRHGVSIETEVADLTTWAWPVSTFDAVVAIFLHLPPQTCPDIHAAMLRALKPCGLIILQAFRPEQLGYASGGPKDVSWLYTSAMLAADFADADILLNDEELVTLDEGPSHRGPAATVGLVARRR